MSILNTVQKGVVSKPRRTVLYGVHGIGKSTWASCWPSPIFVQTEEGADDIDVDKLPQSQTLTEAWGAIMALSSEEHSYKTVVIDSGDWLERLIWKHVCDKRSVESITDIDFGKGYGEASTIFSKVLGALDRCREKGLNVVMLCHARTVKVEPPGMASYTRYEPKLHKTSSNGPCASEILQEWCDELLFANYQVDVRTEKGGFAKERGIAIGSGRRVIYTQETPSFVAKSRLKLPAELPMDFLEYSKFLA